MTADIELLPCSVEQELRADAAIIRSWIDVANGPINREALADRLDRYANAAAELTAKVEALRAERDALRDALREVQTRIAAIGYPASPDGKYNKNGEWTFSDAVPRAVDAEEVEAAFLVIRTALAACRQRGEASND